VPARASSDSTIGRECGDPSGLASAGLMRTIPRAVSLLLGDAEPNARSDGWFAERCAVSQPFVGNVRREREGTQNGYESAERRGAGRDGRAVHTANIGRRALTLGEGKAGHQPLPEPSGAAALPWRTRTATTGPRPLDRTRAIRRTSVVLTLAWVAPAGTLQRRREMAQVRRPPGGSRAQV
jgi:hypothetical protein